LSRRIRLLVVTHSLSGGGAERFAATLLSHLDRRRFEPRACLAKDRRTYDLPADVPVVALGYGGLRHLPRTVHRLRRAVAEARPDLVLSNVLSTNCLVGSALAGAALRPAWVARVGNAPEQGDPLAQRLLARRLYARADALVCNSQALAAALPASYPEAAGRVRAIANPTDFAGLDRRAAEEPVAAHADGGPKLLWMGRLNRQKRPDLAVEALARVRLHCDARLLLCGEGPLARKLERRVAALGLCRDVERLGFVANPFPLLRRADLFLSTSDFEGLPNALIEAQGLGLAAVASRCPYGPDEIVEDGLTGVLVPAGDAGALAGAILELLADPERRREMGWRASERARRLYGLESRMADWEDLLGEVAERRAAGGEGGG
jgi:glycosyltransferase involved in cell wall biosynthesis